MPKLIDLTNKKFGTLTVIKRVENNKHNQAQWLCQCDCGKQVVVRGDALRNGNTKTCGDNIHKISTKLNDLTGQKFDKWLVLQRVENNEYGKARWLCQCDCGTQRIVNGTELTTGKSKSCGCNRHDKKIEDLTGQTFGYLKVLRRVENKGDLAMWECECQACKQNRHTIVAGSRLKRGLVKSCGCMQMKSYGERKIEELLIFNHIPFEQQKSFSDCIFPDTNGYAKFDFWINNKYLIEYDGRQHFMTVNSGWDNEEHLQYTQKHDEYKNEWCKKHNVPLIRIPYTQYDNLCIEDLLLETTKFKMEVD